MIAKKCFREDEQLSFRANIDFDGGDGGGCSRLEVSVACQLELRSNARRILLAHWPLKGARLPSSKHRHSWCLRLMVATGDGGGGLSARGWRNKSVFRCPDLMAHELSNSLD
jgi:hypothetical protein